ncbi:sugar ABC transporter substrate-binding protein [Planococcus shenhongbingii]|uniref:Substrate-binding domain-containing protein n=1 Tax=Planococcus shenhongbingii TaxID=3058398 RepID=A0ABT8NEN0_9BACL|nr:substrate-binding domain-containing protein [Planococcus sp. N017]MDN7246127.1 substrate-binding domain-containing protein [Planococcus sp. N017]
MRKKVVIVLCMLCAVLGFFTFMSAGKAFRSDWQLPAAVPEDQESYRLVLITQELKTPFWNQVGAGAAEQARKEGVSLEVWGSYGNDSDEFLKQIEIALHSKVDGVVVQGLDTAEFKELTKIKAAFYGIPVITIANDVPVAESLRKTYVGSDHYQTGKLLAEQLVKDMGSEGQAILLSDVEQAYSQQQRMRGMDEVLKAYPDISTILVKSGNSDEEVIEATQNVLNQVPKADAFIALNANHVGTMMQEISRRAKLEPFHIYSFDDGADISALLRQGGLDAVIGQSPEKMGQLSVELMMKWIKNEEVPLNPDGYFTDIRILEGVRERP